LWLVPFNGRDICCWTELLFVGSVGHVNQPLLLSSVQFYGCRRKTAWWSIIFLLSGSSSSSASRAQKFGRKEEEEERNYRKIRQGFCQTNFNSKRRKRKKELYDFEENP
jgi:hypothetical protein